MLIAVDGFEASSSERVGVGRLEVELLRNIAKIDKKNSYRIYTPRPHKNDLPPAGKRWKYVIPPFARLWSQAALPWKIIVDRPAPDVFYSPVHYAPRYCPYPLVVGIMDLSFIHFPDLFKPTDLYKLKHWTRSSVERADRVIAISSSTKNDILEAYDVASEKIDVVYPGVSKLRNYETAKFMKDTVSLHKKYGIQKDYILYVGTLQPRKNIALLIEAFKVVNDRAEKKYQLVVAGKKGWMYTEILQKADDLGIGEDVVFTGFVPDGDLPALYQGARCFCLPSLYEGFGFPVLEAMSYGCPVVASNVSSLPEIVGNAGILVDPSSAENIAGGIEKILAMELSERKKIVAKGKKQASKFTWEKAAQQTIAILEKVGKRSKNSA